MPRVKKTQLVGVIGAAATVGGILFYLHERTGDLVSSINLVAGAVTIAIAALYGRHAATFFQEYIRQKSFAEAARGKLTSSVVLFLLGLIATILALMAVVNTLLFLAYESPSGVEDVLYRVLVPLLPIVLYALLKFKVDASAMLDRQKTKTREMLGSVASWRYPGGYLSVPKGNQTPSISSQSYTAFLEALCERSLEIASEAGARHASESDGSPASVFFIADTKERRFVPLAVAGGTPEYRNIVRTELRPPFWNINGFKALYNRYNAEVLKTNPNRTQLREMLDRFRDESLDVISATGVIFEIGRKLEFVDSYDRCLSFRFEFLELLPPGQMEGFKFRHLIGIPVTLFGRRFGVLLLLSDRQMFYTRDKIYWVIGDLFALAAHLGLTNGFLPGRVIDSFFGDDQLAYDDQSVQAAIKLINRVNYQFETSLD